MKIITIFRLYVLYYFVHSYIDIYCLVSLYIYIFIQFLSFFLCKFPNISIICKCKNDELNTFQIQVILVFGILGACRTKELQNTSIHHLKYESDNKLKVTVHDTKNYSTRSFIIKDKYLQFVKKYLSLRSSHAYTDKFFLRYQKGKCVNRVIGNSVFS